MALYRPGDRKHPVTAIPHRILFDGWLSRLAPLELRAIDIQLDRLVRARRGREIETARWLPPHLSPQGGHDWESSPLMRIWDKACQRNPDQTCWFFGLLLWQHMMNRKEAWHFATSDLNDVPMAGTRYYQVRQLARVENFESALTAL
jgi:hypothetical protein